MYLPELFDILKRQYLQLGRQNIKLNYKIKICSPYLPKHDNVKPIPLIVPIKSALAELFIIKTAVITVPSTQTLMMINTRINRVQNNFLKHTGTKY